MLLLLFYIYIYIIHLQKIKWLQPIWLFYSVCLDTVIAFLSYVIHNILILKNADFDFGFFEKAFSVFLVSFLHQFTVFSHMCACVLVLDVVLCCSPSLSRNNASCLYTRREAGLWKLLVVWMIVAQHRE